MVVLHCRVERWKHGDYQTSISLFKLITVEQGLAKPKAKRAEEGQLCDSTKNPMSRYIY
jgi:hypothetical protein